MRWIIIWFLFAGQLLHGVSRTHCLTAGQLKEEGEQYQLVEDYVCHIAGAPLPLGALTSSFVTVNTNYTDQEPTTCNSTLGFSLDILAWQWAISLGLAINFAFLGK